MMLSPQLLKVPTLHLLSLERSFSLKVILLYYGSNIGKLRRDSSPSLPPLSPFFVASSNK